MCGITGFIQTGVQRDVSSSQLAAMVHSIHHRGPDDDGMWFDDQYGVALGHCRLSILDPSSAGHQPMESACGRFVIIFNGEVYNHLDLRKNLEKEGLLPTGGWRGHSDTETLLACFAAWGIEKTLRYSVGMFAIALWDNSEKSLTLARDRMGEKPLYYGWQGGAFLFGSELKSLRAHPAFIGSIDWQAATMLLRMNYIPAPLSIFMGIHKLPAASSLKIGHSKSSRDLLPPRAYWSITECATRGEDIPFRGSMEDAADQLEVILAQAVRLQTVADVPVGAFLSGGVDSSTIVALMKSQGADKVTSLTIGMPDSAMDESKYAAAVARHLGTEHITEMIFPQEALDIIPKLNDIWDEPFADSSQIPTWLVCQKAREHVKVVLSGDGGDELFLGYPQHPMIGKLWRSRIFGRIPLRGIMASAARIGGRQPLVVNMLRKSGTVFGVWEQTDPIKASYRYADRYRGGPVPLNNWSDPPLSFPSALRTPEASAGLFDAMTYLPDDILVKVDRAAMSNSLETRAPMLDHRVVEFALHLPLSLKLKNGESKRILREVLYRHVPRNLIERPKLGFSIPLESWLRGELRPWVEAVLSTINEHNGPWNLIEVKHLWRQHLSGERNCTEQLWAILMLQSFLLKNS